MEQECLNYTLSLPEPRMMNKINFLQNWRAITFCALQKEGNEGKEGKGRKGRKDAKFAVPTFSMST